MSALCGLAVRSNSSNSIKDARWKQMIGPLFTWITNETYLTPLLRVPVFSVSTGPSRHGVSSSPSLRSTHSSLSKSFIIKYYELIEWAWKPRLCSIASCPAAMYHVTRLLMGCIMPQGTKSVPFFPYLLPGHLMFRDQLPQKQLRQVQFIPLDTSTYLCPLRFLMGVWGWSTWDQAQALLHDQPWGLLWPVACSAGVYPRRSIHAKYVIT